MKIRLLGKNLEEIRNLLPAFGMEECMDGTPELVITYGGDGAMLGAARDFPDLPLLPIRDAATAPVCPEHTAVKVLEKFCSGELKITRLPRLSGRISGTEVCGINDLVIHSQEYTSALRYRVFINGELYAREVVGDGVCFAGVHGSTAYYRSITRGIFHVGVGLAFSNSTEAVDHLVLPEDSEVTVEIIRGPGVLRADNDPRRIIVEVGEKVVLKQSDRYVEVAGLAGFMCPECRFYRHRLLSLNEKHR